MDGRLVSDWKLAGVHAGDGILTGDQKGAGVHAGLSVDGLVDCIVEVETDG